MAETAKKGTPKGMEGVEAIMRGEGAMDVAQGAVKRVAPEAPYALEGEKSVLMQENVKPRERVAAEDMVEVHPDLIVEHHAESGEEKKSKKEPTYSDEDIKEHLEKDKSIKSFLANNLKSAQFAVKSFNARGRGKGKGKGAGEKGEKDEYTA